MDIHSFIYRFIHLLSHPTFSHEVHSLIYESNKTSEQAGTPRLGSESELGRETRKLLLGTSSLPISELQLLALIGGISEKWSHSRSMQFLGEGHSDKHVSGLSLILPVREE